MTLFKHEPDGMVLEQGRGDPNRSGPGEDLGDRVRQIVGLAVLGDVGDAVADDDAEAVLQLRALITNGDFEDYWIFHTAREHQCLYPSPDQQDYSLTA